jgi:hypothetical protein
MPRLERLERAARHSADIVRVTAGDRVTSDKIAEVIRRFEWLSGAQTDPTRGRAAEPKADCRASV